MVSEIVNIIVRFVLSRSFKVSGKRILLSNELLLKR